MCNKCGAKTRYLKIPDIIPDNRCPACNSMLTKIVRETNKKTRKMIEMNETKNHETREIEMNTVKYVDCIKGMKSIPDKYFDLCITDPPYNVLIGKTGSDLKRFRRENYFDKKILYDDNMNREEYIEFSKNWFDEATRVSKRLLFTPGNKNLHMWFDICEPREILIHHKSNCSSFTYHCRLARYEFILIYGKFGPFVFRSNVFNVPIRTGFRVDVETIHPAPKEVDLWLAILKRLKPENVFDPFIGSGTTPMACEWLGIPWFGFEKMREYEVDITKKIEFGKNKYRKNKEQRKIEEWIG